uniref:Beta C1 protein n=1 Tax=Cotton leaf curl betasatellite TaxID=134386 RepID=I1SZH1_9VIRU|nr:beta C1 protein [Cotton leaf curl betasatellite]
MATRGTNKEGVSFLVDVGSRGNRKISIARGIPSQKSPCLIKKEGIVQNTYENIHFPFVFTGFEGSIIADFLFAYTGPRNEGLSYEDIFPDLISLYMKTQSYWEWLYSNRTSSIKCSRV